MLIYKKKSESYFNAMCWADTRQKNLSGGALYLIFRQIYRHAVKSVMLQTIDYGNIKGIHFAACTFRKLTSLASAIIRSG